MIAKNIYKPLFPASPWSAAVSFSPAVDTVSIDFDGKYRCVVRGDGHNLIDHEISKRLSAGASAAIEKLELRFPVYEETRHGGLNGVSGLSCANVDGWHLEYPGGNDWSMFCNLKTLTVYRTN